MKLLLPFTEKDEKSCLRGVLVLKLLKHFSPQFLREKKTAEAVI